LDSTGTFADIREWNGHYAAAERLQLLGSLGLHAAAVLVIRP